MTSKLACNERNFQCADCGVCFQDTPEGATLANEHVKLTGHNPDLVCFDVAELVEQALDNIKSISTLRGKGN